MNQGELSVQQDAESVRRIILSDYIHYPERIYPIGRLDKDSEGLILLTNDGTIVNHILKASQYHEKEYIVRVNTEITDEIIQGVSKGVPILDTVTRPCTLQEDR